MGRALRGGCRTRRARGSFFLKVGLAQEGRPSRTPMEAGLGALPRSTPCSMSLQLNSMPPIVYRTCPNHRSLRPRRPPAAPVGPLPLDYFNGRSIGCLVGCLSIDYLIDRLIPHSQLHVVLRVQALDATSQRAQQHHPAEMQPPSSCYTQGILERDRDHDGSPAISGRTAWKSQGARHLKTENVMHRHVAAHAHRLSVDSAGPKSTMPCTTSAL